MKLSYLRSSKWFMVIALGFAVFTVGVELGLSVPLMLTNNKGTMALLRCQSGLSHSLGKSVPCQIRAIADLDRLTFWHRSCRSLDRFTNYWLPVRSNSKAKGVSCMRHNRPACCSWNTSFYQAHSCSDDWKTIAGWLCCHRVGRRTRVGG